MSHDSLAIRMTCWAIWYLLSSVIWLRLTIVRKSYDKKNRASDVNNLGLKPISHHYCGCRMRTILKKSLCLVGMPQDLRTKSWSRTAVQCVHFCCEICKIVFFGGGGRKTAVRQPQVRPMTIFNVDTLDGPVNRMLNNSAMQSPYVSCTIVKK